MIGGGVGQFGGAGVDLGLAGPFNFSNGGGIGSGLALRFGLEPGQRGAGGAGVVAGDQRGPQIGAGGVQAGRRRVSAMMVPGISSTEQTALSTASARPIVHTRPFRPPPSGG